MLFQPQSTSHTISFTLLWELHIILIFFSFSNHAEQCLQFSNLLTTIQNSSCLYTSGFNFLVKMIYQAVLILSRIPKGQNYDTIINSVLQRSLGKQGCFVRVWKTLKILLSFWISRSKTKQIWASIDGFLIQCSSFSLRVLQT